MSIIEDRLALLDSLVLGTGGHQSWEQGACVMEAVAYVAGEPWSDHPKCASPILTSFCMRLNDRLSDESRQLLKPLIPRLVGTRTSAADEETRRWMICDWFVHEYAPALFRHLGQVETAERFEGMAAITGLDEWRSVRSTIYQIRDEGWKRRRVAAAVAAAAAAAAAAADAAADAAAAAVAVAAAAGVAAAAADAAAPFVEAAKAAANEKQEGGGYWEQRDAAYQVLRPHYDKVYAEFTPGLLQSVLGLIDRMIEVGRS